MHLESRAATFRLQFIQHYLTGNEDVDWKSTTSTMLRKVAGLGLDASLFLMNCNFICLRDLPPFYQGLFRAWTLFKWNRLEPAASLFWLLEVPLIHRAHLDVQDSSRSAVENPAGGAGCHLFCF